MFKCVKSFAVDNVDGDGLTIENEHSIIPAGSIWYIPTDEDYRLSGGDIRLENEGLTNEGLTWIEISFATFKKCFEEIEKESEKLGL